MSTVHRSHSKRLITQQAAAERYSVTDRTIRAWISTGRITGYRLPGGRSIRVDPDEIDSSIDVIPTVRHALEGGDGR